MDQEKNISDSRPAQPRKAADCVSGQARKPQHAPPAGFINVPAGHPGRKSLTSSKILNSAEICSRFEQLSGRGGFDALDTDGINKRKISGSETRRTN